jgi:MFS family permease
VVEKYGRGMVVVALVVVMLGFTLVLVSVLTLPAEVVPWAVGLAMGVAGLGGGAVIAPNQTLALADVPVTSGGVAGSIGQVGQRVGTAVGLAATTAAFYATVYAGRNSEAELLVYQDAYRYAALVVLSFLALALVAAVTDLRARNGGRMQTLEPSADD